MHHFIIPHPESFCVHIKSVPIYLTDHPKEKKKKQKTTSTWPQKYFHHKRRRDSTIKALRVFRLSPELKPWGNMLPRKQQADISKLCRACHCFVEVRDLIEQITTKNSIRHVYSFLMYWSYLPESMTTLVCSPLEVVTPFIKNNHQRSRVYINSPRVCLSNSTSLVFDTRTQYCKKLLGIFRRITV